MKHHCKHPRRLGVHVQAVLRTLDDSGAEDIDLLISKHLLVRYRVCGVPMKLSMALTPRDRGRTALNACHQVMRQIRAARLGPRTGGPG